MEEANVDIEYTKKLLKVSKEFIKEFKLEDSEYKADFIIIANELSQRTSNEVKEYLSNYKPKERTALRKMIKFFKERMKGNK